MSILSRMSSGFTETIESDVPVTVVSEGHIYRVTKKGKCLISKHVALNPDVKLRRRKFSLKRD